MTESWLGLSTPKDLLKKLRKDCGRVRDEPLDAYSTFDFFVTAFHLLDWLYPGNENKAHRRQIIEASPLLAICQHVANGLKHLRLNDSSLKSVAGTGTAGTFDKTFDRTFDRTRLVLHLDGEAAAKFGSTVDVSKLAPKIVDWWEQELSKVE